MVLKEYSLCRVKQLKKDLVQGYVHCTLIGWRLAEKERKTLSSRVSLHGLEALEGKGGIRSKRSVKPMLYS